MDRAGDIIAGILIIIGTGLFFVYFGAYYKDNSKEEKQGQVYLFFGLLLVLAGLLWFTAKLLSTKLDF